MAATVAVMLYMELPRVAFEAQRDKEQLLIDRGEQYTRAINLYVRKFNRYPADFDALQSTQNQRFLRHKYIDPMTGKDDWRIVHVGPGGVFTDSLVYGKKKPGTGAAAEQQNFITEMQQTGGNQITAAAGGVNVGTRQRPTDQPGMPGDPNNPNQPPPQIGPNGLPVQNPTTAFGQNMANGFPNQPQTGANGQIQLPPGVQLPLGYQLPPGYQAPPTSQPFQGTQSPNIPTPSASNLIGQLLTTPRPGGLNGLGGAPGQATVDQNGNPLPAGTGNGFGIGGAGQIGGGLGGAPGAAQPANNTGTALAPMQGQTVGGGIAGVASKREQDGIKSYKDRTPYNEWEFVYDITKDPLHGGGLAGAVPPGAQGAPGQNGAGLNPSPFAPTAPPPGTAPPPPPVTPVPNPGMPAPQPQ
jgi:hypothetical protein